MGEHARQNELWSEPVKLARRIPADHPLRKLRETLKLDFVREEVAGFYGRKGERLGRSGDRDASWRTAPL